MTPSIHWNHYGLIRYAGFTTLTDPNFFDRRVEHLLNQGATIVTTGHAAASLTEKGFRPSMGVGDLTRPVLFPGRRQVADHQLAWPPWPCPSPRLLPPVMGSMQEFIQSNHISFACISPAISAATFCVPSKHRVTNQPAIDLEETIYV